MAVDGVCLPPSRSHGIGSDPAVGTRKTLLTAAGGLTASFSQVTAPPGWRVKATATAIIATYTG